MSFTETLQAATPQAPKATSIHDAHDGGDDLRTAPNAPAMLQPRKNHTNSATAAIVTSTAIIELVSSTALIRFGCLITAGCFTLTGFHNTYALLITQLRLVVGRNLS